MTQSNTRLNCRPGAPRKLRRHSCIQFMYTQAQAWLGIYAYKQNIIDIYLVESRARRLGSLAGFAWQRGGLATSSGQRSDRCRCRVSLPSAAVRSVRTRLLSAERQQGGALLPTGTGRNLGPPRPNEAQRAGQQLEGQKPPIVVGRQLEAYVCVRPAHPSRS